VIFTCDRAKAVWSSLGVWEKILEVIRTDRSGSVIVEEVLRRGETVDHLSVGFSELILTGGWYLWWERSQLVHGENIQQPSKSGLSIATLTKNYKMATIKGTKERQGWQKPPEKFVKVNIDASFDEGTGNGNTGVIIRDWTGGAIAASHTFLLYLVDAPMAKAFALKEGLLLAQHAGCNRLIVQSDCMEVVKTMATEDSRQIQVLLCMMSVILFGAGFR